MRQIFMAFQVQLNSACYNKNNLKRGYQSESKNFFIFLSSFTQQARFRNVLTPKVGLLNFAKICINIAIY